MAEPLLIAKNAQTECHLLPGLANRHGLITGATGTGKTVTLQTMAENFSKIGVPVFMADVKGDLTGISQPGTVGEKLAAVIEGTRHHALRAPRLPRHAVGRVRRARPSGPRHGVRHGPAAAGAHAQRQRNPGRRAATGVQDRRRQRPAAAGPEGPAGHAAARGRQREGIHHRLRQHQRRQRRRHPARADADRGPGRRQVLRRAHAQHCRLPADRRLGPGRGEYPGRGQAA